MAVCISSRFGLLWWLGYVVPASATYHLGRAAYGWLDRQCLESGFKPHERRSLPPGTFGPNAKNLTLGMSDCCWTVQELPSWIAKIIIEEALGLHVDLVRVGDVTPAFLGAVGCKDYNDWTCYDFDTADPPLHVALGAWYTDMVGAADYALVDSGPGLDSALAVQNVGPIGFGTIDTDYVMEETVEAARLDKGLDLQWGPQLAQAAPYFTKLVDFNGSRGLYQLCVDDWIDYDVVLESAGFICNSAHKYDNPWRMGKSGSDGQMHWDPDGAIPIKPYPSRDCSGPPTATGQLFPGWKCILNGFWASPACQALGGLPEEQCILYSDFGSGFAWASNVISAWEDLNIPILYFHSGPWYAQEELMYDFAVNGNRIMFNWWSPDATNELAYYGGVTAHSVAPRRVSYPPGLGAASRQSVKIARKELQGVGATVPFFLEMMTFTEADVQAMHTDLAKYVRERNLVGYEAQDEAYFNISCEWVRNNKVSSGRKAGEQPWGNWVMAAKDCPPGTTFQANIVSCIKCPAGRTAQLGGDCHQCSPGTYCPAAGTGYPIVCEEGRYCPEGSIFPVKCAPGTFNDLPGRGNVSSCRQCLPGYSSQAEGAEDCERCGLGRATGVSGSIECDLCMSGTFGPILGATACQSCPGARTSQLGSRSADACTCPADHYLVGAGNASQCESCPLGTVCDGFGDTRGEMPLVAQGFYMSESASRTAKSLDIFLCTSPEACPGQKKPGDPVCPSGSTGINCGQCMQNFVRSGEVCVPCSSVGSQAVPIACMLAVVVASGALMFHVTRKQSTGLTAKAHQQFAPNVVTIFVSFGQYLSLFKRLRIQWPKGFGDSVGSASWLLFDAEVARIPCALDVLVTFTTGYVVQLAMPVIAVFFMCVWWAMSVPLSKVSKGCVRPGSLNAVLASTGMMLKILYTPIVAATVSIFACYENPNGKRTIRTHPAMLCHGDGYTSVLPVSVLGILVYLIGVTAVFVWIDCLAPTRYSDDGFRKRSFYLINAYRPDRWWYGVPKLLRSCLLAMVPVMAPDSGWIQCFLFSCIFVLASLAHIYLEPYINRLANRLEVFCLSLLGVIIFMGTLYVDRGEDNETAKDSIAILLVLFFAIAVILLAASSIVAVVHLLQPECVRERDRKTMERAALQLSSVSKAVLSMKEQELKELIEISSFKDKEHIGGVAAFVSVEAFGLQSIKSRVSAGTSNGRRNSERGDAEAFAARAADTFNKSEIGRYKKAMLV